MAAAVRIDGLVVTGGQVRVALTAVPAGQLPAESNDGFVIAASDVDGWVKGFKDRWQEIALAALVLRADQIDPAHGAAFRNAMIGKTLTIDLTIDNVMVRS